MKKVKFSEWRVKTLTRKVDNIIEREKIKYRTIKLENRERIEEGTIIEYQGRYLDQTRYIPVQQHLIGYYYVSVIDSKNNDIFWIQADNQGDKEYMLARDTDPSTWKWMSRKKAIQGFKKLVKEKYGIEIEF